MHSLYLGQVDTLSNCCYSPRYTVLLVLVIALVKTFQTGFTVGIYSY